MQQDRNDFELNCLVKKRTLNLVCSPLDEGHWVVSLLCTRWFQLVSLWIKPSSCVTIQIKTTARYFDKVPFIMLHNPS